MSFLIHKVRLALFRFALKQLSRLFLALARLLFRRAVRTAQRHHAAATAGGANNTAAGHRPAGLRVLEGDCRRLDRS